jgi:hypothetical protein
MARPSMLDAVLKKKKEQGNYKRVATKLPSLFDNVDIPNDEVLVETITEDVPARWSDADQTLISIALSYFDKHPAMKIGGASLIKAIMEGPNATRAQTGELQEGLKKMISLVEDGERLMQEVAASIPGQAVTPTTETVHEEEEMNDGRNQKWSPDVQILIGWFVNNEGKLPATTFSLSSYETITNPVGFYAHLNDDIAAIPNKFRNDHLLDKLGKLQRIIEI